MRILTAFLVLVSLALGQTLSSSLTLADGSTKPLTLIQDGEAFEIRERNPGLPDNWGQPWTPGAPVAFDSWTITLPRRFTILAGGFYGARAQADGTVQLARPGDFHYPARRNGRELWPGTETHHRIFPGDTLYCRVVPADDPWELRKLQAIPAANVAAALQVLAFDEARIARWPWLQKVLGWYTYSAASMDPATPPGSRDCGWLLIPANFIHRWSGNPGGLPAIAHWYGLGTRQAGVSLTNEHYGSEAAWIGQGLRTSDPTAVTVGLYLLRQKLAYGLVDCDAACPHKGKWRTETGDMARGTQAMVPSWAKEYDKGLAAASVLLPGDAFIHRGAATRQAYLLSCGHEWQGAGGARNIGHFLENLRHWYVATGDDRIRARADSELAWAMGKIGALPYCPENPGSTTASAGEGLLFLAAARWWAAHGAGVQHQSKLDAMLAWYVAHAWDPNTGRVGYFLDATTGAITWSGSFQGVFWLTMPGLDPAVRTKIETYMFTHYANTPDCDAAFGGEGPGWEKWVPMLVCWGACSS